MLHKKSIAVFLFVSFSVFLADQVTKFFFFTDTLAGKPLIEGIVHLVVHRNYGISFNIPIPRLLILGITSIVLASILYLVHKRKAMSISILLGLALIFGGAIGNMLDRIIFEYVRDWLLFFNRSAINLADISILLGILIYLVSDTQSRRKHKGSVLDMHK